MACVKDKGLPVDDVRVISLAAGLAIATQRDDVEIAMVAGLLVLVGLAPGVGRHRFLEVGAAPFGDARGLRHQGFQALFGGGQAADVEAVGLEGFFECVDLGSGYFDFRLSDFGEVARGDVTGEKADDDHHDKEFEEGEAVALTHL